MLTMFRLTTTMLFLIACVCGKESSGNSVDGVIQIVKSSSSKVMDETVEYFALPNSSHSLLFAGDNESQVVDVDSAFNYSFNDDELANDTESSRNSTKALRIGRWMILHCDRNEFWWMCDLKRRLVISELDFWDTLRFMVGGDKLKIGCSSKQHQFQPSKPVVKNFHLRILLECPSQCNTDLCLSSGLYFPSFWLGIVIGVMVGIIFVILLTTCISASVAGKN